MMLPNMFSNAFSKAFAEREQGFLEVLADTIPFPPIQDPPERRLAPSPPPHEGPESPSILRMDALRSSAALDVSMSATSLTADGEESYFAEILCSKLGKFGV